MLSWIGVERYWYRHSGREELHARRLDRCILYSGGHDRLHAGAGIATSLLPLLSDGRRSPRGANFVVDGIRRFRFFFSYGGVGIGRSWR